MKHSEIIVFLLFLWLTACGRKQTESRMVTVSIEPQRYFAEWIVGGRFAVQSVVPAGQSPENYDPTPRQMAQIGQSEAYLRIGPIGFEQAWLEKIRENNPKLPVYDLSAGMPLVKETVHGGEGHAHSHTGGVDPHIWSSIEGARIIARNTLDAFVELDQAHADTYRTNYDQLLATIDSTETVIRQLLALRKHCAFIIYHPALTYFAAEFGLTQLCIEMEGKEPSPTQLAQLIAEARQHDAQVVFVQQEFDHKNAELIAKETGCHVVTINPLAYQWDRELIHIANALSDGETD